MHYYGSIGDFLALLGAATEAPEVDVNELETRIRAPIERALAEGAEIPSAIFRELCPELRYRTEISEFSIEKVRSSRRYEGEGEALTLIDADCSLSVRPMLQAVDTEAPEEWRGWGDDEPVDVNLQLFLPDEGSGYEPEVVGANAPLRYPFSPCRRRRKRALDVHAPRRIDTLLFLGDAVAPHASRSVAIVSLATGGLREFRVRRTSRPHYDCCTSPSGDLDSRGRWRTSSFSIRIGTRRSRRPPGRS